LLNIILDTAPSIKEPRAIANLTKWTHIIDNLVNLYFYLRPWGFHMGHNTDISDDESGQNTVFFIAVICQVLYCVVKLIQDPTLWSETHNELIQLDPNAQCQFWQGWLRFANDMKGLVNSMAGSNKHQAEGFLLGCESSAQKIDKFMYKPQ